jgi:hypothetical protein
MYVMLRVSVSVGRVRARTSRRGPLAEPRCAVYSTIPRFTLLNSIHINLFSQRDTEENIRQLETKLGAIAHTRHKARLRNATQTEAEPNTQNPNTRRKTGRSLFAMLQREAEEKQSRTGTSTGKVHTEPHETRTKAKTRTNKATQAQHRRDKPHTGSATHKHPRQHPQQPQSWAGSARATRPNQRQAWQRTTLSDTRMPCRGNDELLQNLR